MIPATSQRVPCNTSEEINQRIRTETENRIEQYRYADELEITRRLQELDREWDTERFLEANASTLAFTGCVLAATVNRKWVLLPMAVTGFLLQHAVQGWCPPLPLIRRLGIRTQREIDEERFALKSIRGDFAAIADTETSVPTTEELLTSVEE